MTDWTQNPAKTDADRHTVRLARYAAREEFSRWLLWAFVIGAVLLLALRLLQ